MSKPPSLSGLSVRNPWIKETKALHKTAERRKRGLFLVEGLNALDAALQVSWPLQCVCVTERWAGRHQDVLSRMGSVEVKWVSEEAMKALSSTVSPDGVIAICHSPHDEDFSLEALTLSQVNLGIAAFDLQDPGNLGSLVRTLGAVGGDGLFLGGESVDPHSPKVLRASAGQWFHNPPRRVSRFSELFSSLKQAGVQVLAAALAAPHRKSESFWECDLKKPTVFLLGNEGSGLPEDLIANASAAVTIPMHSRVESLNVGVAGALLLYEARRQRLSN